MFAVGSPGVQKSIMNGSSPEAQHLCRYPGDAGNREDHPPGNDRFGGRKRVRCDNFLPAVDFIPSRF
jgi:hypothetical protein